MKYERIIFHNEGRFVHQEKLLSAKKAGIESTQQSVIELPIKTTSGRVVNESFTPS